MKLFLAKTMENLNDKVPNKSSLMEQALYFLMLMIKNFQGMQLKKISSINQMPNSWWLMVLDMKKKEQKLTK